MKDRVKFTEHHGFHQFFAKECDCDFKVSLELIMNRIPAGEYYLPYGDPH